MRTAMGASEAIIRSLQHVPPTASRSKKETQPSAPNIAIPMAFHDLDTLRQAASGRWADVLASAGFPAHVLDGRNHPCPKCGGRDRFAAFPDFPTRGAVHCRHCFTRGCVISPSDGIATLQWWLGASFPEAIEFLADSVGAPNSASLPAPKMLSWPRCKLTTLSNLECDPEAVAEHTKVAREAFQRIDGRTRRRLATHLHVCEPSLVALRVGLGSDGRSLTWPMRDARGAIIGIRMSGLPWSDSVSVKWSRRGSRAGIFLPRTPRDLDPQNGHSGDLFVVEGASDTAAALGLGLWVIGRASCTSSTALVDQYVRQHRPTSLTVISDNDQAGRNGAKRLAKSLAQDLPQSLAEVNVVFPPPPYKDLREWVASGATSSDLVRLDHLASYTPMRQATFDFV